MDLPLETLSWFPAYLYSEYILDKTVCDIRINS